jgi:hypothetical protein
MHTYIHAVSAHSHWPWPRHTLTTARTFSEASPLAVSKFISKITIEFPSLEMFDTILEPMWPSPVDAHISWILVVTHTYTYTHLLTHSLTHTPLHRHTNSLPLTQSLSHSVTHSVQSLLPMNPMGPLPVDKSLHLPSRDPDTAILLHITRLTFPSILFDHLIRPVKE